jgi:hypothetical protein
MQDFRQSPHDCSIWPQALSPLVQVTQQPSLVNSHLHVPQQRLHWQTVMPLKVQQQLHMPPASILQRFCRAPQATSSSQEHVILKPPVHFSNFISQRGRITQLLMPGMALGAGEPIGLPMPGLAIPIRSINIALDILTLL